MTLPYGPPLFVVSEYLECQRQGPSAHLSEIGSTMATLSQMDASDYESTIIELYQSLSTAELREGDDVDKKLVEALQKQVPEPKPHLCSCLLVLCLHLRLDAHGLSPCPCQCLRFCEYLCLCWAPVSVLLLVPAYTTCFCVCVCVCVCVFTARA